MLVYKREGEWERGVEGGRWLRRAVGAAENNR